MGMWPAIIVLKGRGNWPEWTRGIKCATVPVFVYGWSSDL